MDYGKLSKVANAIEDALLQRMATQKDISDFNIDVTADDGRIDVYIVVAEPITHITFNLRLASATGTQQGDRT